MAEITIFKSIVAWFKALPAIVQGVAVSFALNKIAEQFIDNDFDQQSVNYDKSIKTNNTSNTHPIPVVYGKRIVGGSEYRSVSGTKNEFLHRILVLSEGEIDSVTKIFLNDKNIDTISKYDGLITSDIKLGADNQTASNTAVSQVSGWSGNCIGFKLAYLHLRLKFDREAFNNVPKLTAEVKGKKVYDPRNSAHSQTDNSTWEWSDNPVLCILDFLTNSIYGRGIPYSQIDLDTFITEANYCDTTIDYIDTDGNLLDASERKRYTCNGVLNTQNKALENLKKLCSSCRAVIIPPGKQYKIKIDRTDTAVFTFNEDNLIGDITLVGSDIKEMKNTARVRFFDVNNNYDEAIHNIKSPIFKIEDSNEDLVAEMQFPFTNTHQRTNYLANQTLKQSRQHWKIAFTSDISAIGVEAMDLVYIKSKILGYTGNGKLFRINRVELKPTEQLVFSAEEYDTSVYDVELEAPPAFPDTNLPNPFETRPVVNLQADSSESVRGLLIATDGTLVSRIKITWTEPELSYIDKYEVGISVAGENAFTSIFTEETTYYATGVVDTLEYDIRVRAVYVTGKKSEYVEITHQVATKSQKPAEPKSFSVSTGMEYTQLYTWEQNTTELDIAGYRIKFSDNLSATWDDMSYLHGTDTNRSLVLSSPYESYLLSSGTYKFGIKTVDTSGNESENARFTTATIDTSPFRNLLEAFYPRQSGWETSGTITDGYIDDASGNIVASGNITWDDFANTTWSGASTWTNGQSSTVVYETNGNFFSGAELTYRPAITVNAVGSVTIECDYSSDGSTFSGSFQSLTGSVTNKGIKVKVTVTGTNPIISGLAILLDGKGLEEELNDLDTSTLDSAFRTGVGDFKLPLQTNFNNIRTVSLQLQGNTVNLSARVISKTTTVGGNLAPQILIANTSGTNTDAIVDCTIKGY